jgi:hypothetical protein
MKHLTVVSLFFVLLSIASMAEAFEYEGYFSRDNSVCRVGKGEVEIKVMGQERYTQSDDAQYGDKIFAIYRGHKSFLKLNNNGIGRYRFIHGANEICSKALSISTKPDEVAIVLGRDNRPFGDTLSILYFNLLTGGHEIVDTSHLVDVAFISQNRLFFRLKSDPLNSVSGVATIEGEKYQYTQEDFEAWVVFDGIHFNIDKKMTFENYHGDQFFLSEKDFFREKGNSGQLAIATNHAIKKKCMRFSKFSSWKCISIGEKI